MAVDPAAKFAYVVNEGGGNVSAYQISETGALTPIPGSPFAAGKRSRRSGSRIPRPSSPTWQIRVSNNVSAYSIGENGARRLSRVPRSSAGIESVSVAADPTGRFVYVVSKFSHNVSAYQIGENGALTPVVGSPFPAGVGPNSVAFSPNPQTW